LSFREGAGAGNQASGLRPEAPKAQGAPRAPNPISPHNQPSTPPPTPTPLPPKVDSITIPVGPRLGDKVVEARGVSKGFGDRLLVEGMEFSVPPGENFGHGPLGTFGRRKTSWRRLRARVGECSVRARSQLPPVWWPV
jgi:ATPase subunit of ABC transporter with duplicated ATPase domains